MVPTKAIISGFAVTFALMLVVGIVAHPAVGASNDVVEVTHDLRTDAVVDHWNEHENLTSSVDNTEVRVEENIAFVKLSVSNPNGYATQVTVDVPQEVVEPAALGEVDAVGNDDVTASWELQQDLSTGDHYTRVTATVPAGESVTFAPSKARVISLEWTSDAEDAANSSWIPEIGFLQDDLEKNEYTITAPQNSSRVSVPLTNSDGDEVEEWHATYTVDGRTLPVSSDVEDPVYVVESGESVEFVFNDKDAEVSFTANPSTIDKVSHSVNAWTSGYSALRDVFSGFGLTVSPTIGGGVV